MRGETRRALAVQGHREPGALALGQLRKGAQHGGQLLVDEQPQFGIGARVAAGRERVEQRLRLALVGLTGAVGWRIERCREAEDLVLARGGGLEREQRLV